ncbi:MAG TPA: sigma-54-dependent transcriptional regulator [Candidatus Brocadiia bacterium]|nr:sigma-54 dependent transcriptional regulator [Candidatus Brocadiales bacterium]
MMHQRILITDDEERMRRVLAMACKDIGNVDVIACDGSDALPLLEKERFHLVITDMRTPKMGRLEFLKHIRNKDPDLPIIVITAFDSIETAVEAIKEGAFDYITKPFKDDTLKIAIKKALKVGSLTAENKYLRQELEAHYNFCNIVGTSPRMVETLCLAGEVSQTDSTVLILGESGTGKELIARAIHLNSPRSNGPMVAINCAALPENLLESELFGYEKGAFTGADKTKKGRFELASGGTFFLDEISEMNPTIQAKVLRVIEAREMERVGGTETIKVDVRIICATNKNLSELVKNKKFRDDLFYRINVFPIVIPPLRERPEDILPLSRYFIERYCIKMGKGILTLSKEVEKLLLSHRWEGNIRELQNTIERAVILCKGNVITPGHLPLIMTKKVSMDEDEKERIPAETAPIDIPPEGLSLNELEKQLVLQALQKSKNNKTKAARLLGLTRGTFRYRLEKYGLKN